MRTHARAPRRWTRCCAIVLGLLFARDAFATPAPVVYLHGLCGGPEHGCAYFRRVLGTSAPLSCPVAPARCPGGGATWHAPDRALSLAVGASASPPGVLVGFSQGGFAVRRLAARHPGRYPALVIVATMTTLTARELRRWGVRRVVLAASRDDLTHRALRDNVLALQREGFPARFVDLGGGGHTFVARGHPERWAEALAWAATAAEEPPPTP